MKNSKFISFMGTTAKLKSLASKRFDKKQPSLYQSELVVSKEHSEHKFRKSRSKSILRVKRHSKSLSSNNMHFTSHSRIGKENLEIAAKDIKKIRTINNKKIYNVLELDSAKRFDMRASTMLREVRSRFLQKKKIQTVDLIYEPDLKNFLNSIINKNSKKVEIENVQRLQVNNVNILELNRLQLTYCHLDIVKKVSSSLSIRKLNRLA